ncbi:hypothetical protein TWF192_007240 [Orbilia oligospora]|uniref:DUF7582 domain-containing protein n=1 Tax=Orbilia oligospora TaxID=2813651 RepID=A0A6G1ML82_ORBOL|nr:hypothetical protein TWF191_010747 [Orbilia oligospora]KAF3262572.1 hypothetical protein TWF192_007240 [Orbilia oligospora]
MGPSQSREQRRPRRHRTPQLDQPQSQPPRQQQHEAEEEVSNEETLQQSYPSNPTMSSSLHHHHHHHYSSSSTPYPHTPTPPLRTPSFNNNNNGSRPRSSRPHLQSLSIPPLNNSHPNDNNETGIDTPTLTTALSYISARLLQKTKLHHTFIVTGSIIFSLFFRSKGFTKSVSLLQTSGLSGKEREVLISAVLRAGEKFGIEREDWVNNGGEREVKRFGMGGSGEEVGGGSSSGHRRGGGGGGGSGEVDELVARSLGQGVVVFSGDGMTLYAVDFIYELRRGLHLLSKALESGGEDMGGRGGREEEEEEDGVDLEDMVELVRRLVAVEGKGRGLRRGVVEGRYERLVFSDYAWMVLGREYERRFGEKGLKEDDEETDEEEEEGILMADRDSVWTDGS